MELIALIQNSHCAVCLEPGDHAKESFIASPIELSYAPGAGSNTINEIVLTRCETFLKLDKTPSWSVSFSAQASDANAIEKAVDDVISNKIFSCASTSHVVNIHSPSSSKDDRCFVVSHGTTSVFLMGIAGAASSLSVDAVTPEGKFAIGTRSTLSTNRPSVVIISHQTGESTLLPESGS